jgi:signal transduction histidine kinase/DNA-binding response OmpR family regulator
MRIHTPLLLLTLLGLFALGCQKEPPKRYTIGFSQCTGGDEWREEMLRGMKRELAFHSDVAFLYKDAQYNTQRQVRQIRELVGAGVDLLIVSPNEDQPITPIVEAVYRKGIPVVVVDRRISSRAYTAYVGGNNYEVGKTAGQYIGALLNGKGKLLVITGQQTSSPAVDRHRGFLEALARFPATQVLTTIDGGWEKATTKPALLKVIDQYPEVDLVFAHNDRMAKAAHEVYQARGRSDRVQFVGIDALGGPAGGMQLVVEGMLRATILYGPGGEEAIRTAMHILRREPYQKENILQTAVIDSSNVRMIKLQSNKVLTQQADIERQQQKLDNQLSIYQSQRNLLYILSGTLLVAVTLGAVVLYSLVENKKINKTLQAKNEEILAERNKTFEMAEKAREATETKFRFFTNISHEFRTPLTLILAPVEEILSAKGALPGPVRKDLQLVRKNALRLLRLVNQLMDFRKIESGKIEVNATENDLIAFLRDIMLPFQPTANQRRIDFRLVTQTSRMPLWFDTDMMDKVFFNLLSNAFKFTPDGGRIHLHVLADAPAGAATITVTDTGVGMAPEEADRAFEIFYQGKRAKARGTGLGLPLTQEFVELHQGKITLVSQPDEGTTFTIALPLGKAHFREEELATEKAEWLPTNPLAVEEEKNESPAQPSGDAEERLPVEREHSVLVIEDNEGLRNFLEDKLKPAFGIIAAADGTRGMQEAFKRVPDVIICDIMLPDTDGLKVTSTLKADLRTSHIPVILLTAKSTAEQQIEGMQTLADLYLTKPFNVQVLTENIRSLLANRAILRNHYRGEVTPDPKVAGALSVLDKKFVNDFRAVIEAKLADASLTVDSLSRDMGLSRIQLYRKVKALLGSTVNDYIQTVRLHKACHRLQQPGVTITEVAYGVGYSSPAYFATAFKARYGLSPSEYKNQQFPSGG